MKSTPELEKQLKKYASQGLIVSKPENNQHLKLSYKGSGGLIPEKWNVKIYTTGSVVCVDHQILQNILRDKIRSPDSSKALIEIDEAGWGFPLLGVMVGVCDGSEVKTDMIDVSFFQNPAYKNKTYLREYARKGYNIVTEYFNARPDTHRIEICSGYENRRLRTFLREKGFEVNVVEIKGMLQDNLEKIFRDYVYDLFEEDLAYDPKELIDKGNRSQVAWLYKRALSWGRKHTPHLLKSGWKSIGESVHVPGGLL